MDRLTPLDVWFLHAEDGIDHMHMGLVTRMGGPCPDHADVLADVANRLDRIPRYRQRVAWPALGRPVWVDDTDFDVARHVLRTTVPPPGDEAALADLAGRLFEREIDRAHPLWEIWVIDGFADGSWATVQKVHHSLTDGVGGSALVAALVDAVPDAPPPPPSTWTPSPPPSSLACAADGVVTGLQDAAATLRRWRPAPRKTASTLLDLTAGALTYSHDLLPTHPTVLNGPLHAGRRWLPARVEREDVDAIRRAYGVSLNDVALTAASGGIRDLLLAHGESVAGREVRTLVPVSLRRPSEDGVLHNRVAAMIADLPVGIADPVTRLEVLHDRLGALKRSGETEVTATIVDVSPHLPWVPVTTTLRTAARLLHRHVQRHLNTVTTNVPGPPVPLWWMGRPVQRAWPAVPVGESVRLGIAIFTYLGDVTFGVTADRAALPDADLVARGIESTVASLRQALHATV